MSWIAISGDNHALASHHQIKAFSNKMFDRKSNEPIISAQLKLGYVNSEMVAKLFENRVIMREVAGSIPGGINTQDFKITEEKLLPL